MAEFQRVLGEFYLFCGVSLKCDRDKTGDPVGSRS